MERGIFFYVAALLLLAACGGGNTTFTASPNAQATCGPPAPSAPPSVALAYPMPNATMVPTSIGIIVFAGAESVKITMESSGGTSVLLGAPAAAPSPLPSPYATPANISGNVPYFAEPVPTLSPATTYALSYTYTDYNGIPPACTGPVTQALGAFTTQ